MQSALLHIFDQCEKRCGSTSQFVGYLLCTKSNFPQRTLLYEQTIVRAQIFSYNFSCLMKAWITRSLMPYRHAHDVGLRTTKLACTLPGGSSNRTASIGCQHQSAPGAAECTADLVQRHKEQRTGAFVWQGIRPLHTGTMPEVQWSRQPMPCATSTSTPFGRFSGSEYAFSSSHAAAA
jgi:hypothetical protein